MSILSLVVGGVIVWTSLSLGGDATYEASPSAVAAETSLTTADQTKPVSDTTRAALVTPDPTSTITPAPAPPAVQTSYSLQTVEGISLSYDQQDVIEQLGKPAGVTNDDYNVGFQIFHYPQMKIGFSEGYVDYVKVMASAGTISIDGHTIPITLEAVVSELGEPDFVAEDGLVFKGPQAVIKVFVDLETHELTSIDYFHRTSA
jgi:hypothetical protein